MANADPELLIARVAEFILDAFSEQDYSIYGESLKEMRVMHGPYAVDMLKVARAAIKACQDGDWFDDHNLMAFDVILGEQA